MERIKTETVKFSRKDIENLLLKHLKDVEKLSGAVEIKWLDGVINPKRDKDSIIIEIISSIAVATGPI